MNSNNFSQIGTLAVALLILAPLNVLAAAPQTDRDLLRSARQHKSVFDDQQALDDYAKFLALHPDNEQVRFERADELRNEQRWDECIVDYKILIKSKNKVWAGKAATELARIYQKRHQYKDAIETFKLARSFGIPVLLTELSDCYLAAGDAKTALEIANEMMKNEPDAGRIRRAQAYVKLNHPKSALEDIDFLISKKRAHMAHFEKESPERFADAKVLVEYLKLRAPCYDAMKQPQLAANDRKEIHSLEELFYNEVPFRMKEK